MKLCKDKSFYATFFRLFSVIVLQNVIVLSVNLADNVMIGAYSENALSGVAAVNQLQFFLQQAMHGVSDALVSLASQYWGQKRTDPVKQLGKIALIVGCAIGILLFIVTGIAPYGCMRLFTDSEEIIKEGVEYLLVVRWSYLFFSASYVLLALLRSVEIVNISLWVSVATLIVNISLNYCLIFGNFGFPALGAAGAAIATLTARVVEFLILLVYLIRIDKRLIIRFREDILRTDKVLFGDFLRHCVFFIVVASMFGVSTGLQTVILGHMNDSAIAANSVASTLFQVLKVASIGAASATGVIIGKTIGGGNLKKLHEYVNTFQVIFLCIGVLTSIFLYLLRVPILSLYDLSAETKEMANRFLLVLCITCIGTAYEMPVIVGIVRGGGDAKFVFWNDLISIWCVVLPVSFLAAFVFKWDPAIVVFCLNSDQVFKCAAGAIKCNRYTWMKNLTRKEEVTEGAGK